MFPIYVVELVSAAGVKPLVRTGSLREALGHYERAVKVLDARTTVRMHEITATGGRTLRDSQSERIPADKPIHYEADGDVLFAQ